MRGLYQLVCFLAIVYVLDYSSSTIRDFMAAAFLKCTYTWKCIAPKGSDLSNHRFDQAALTLLMGYLQVSYGCNLRYRYFPVIHSDLGNQEAKTRVVLNNLFLKIQHTYSITITNILYNTSGLHFPSTFSRRSRDLRIPHGRIPCSVQVVPIVIVITLFVAHCMGNVVGDSV